MVTLIDTFVPSGIYNTLPHIHDVSNVPIDHSKDLEDLRMLLVKYEVPNDICVRLIHKHFDTHEGEVMVFEKITLPAHGKVQTMKPVMPSGNTQLHGIHYFVNDVGDLQAYEYANCDPPDMTTFESFLGDFCRIVLERGLQSKFGLKLKRGDELDRAGWTEFEFHQKRSTIMLQDGMPMPKGDFDCSVSTEWNAIMTNDGTRTCKHKTTCRHGSTVCNHCKHCNRHEVAGNCGIGDDGFATGFYLGGQKVVPGTPIHDIVSALVVAL
ncbi:Uncharacterized protein TPAR_05453 [Tolypocladium paradoxum]|uniref:Uncharacterized protein n=1 Tax=Tolypocladium paradoxum TaxID=94208 RepID=A0A2S4KVZ2_9HYPO|nr:Uncharacterized protein TPAR_05453 [Tolypocladium paradoxum]